MYFITHTPKMLRKSCYRFPKGKQETSSARPVRGCCPVQCEVNPIGGTLRTSVGVSTSDTAGKTFNRQLEVIAVYSEMGCRSRMLFSPWNS